MTDVGRVHVRCRAPVEEEARALRLRDRLVRTARTHLPGALEQALAGRSERRIFAERVTVELDFDPDDYDDVTTALLWAGRVYRALDAAGGSGSEAGGVAVFETDREYFGAAALEYAESGELRWVFAELACGAGSPSPAAFLAAFGTRARVAALAAALTRRVEAAAALWRRLSPPERRAVLEALAGTRAWGDWSAEAEPPHGAEDADDPAGGGDSRARGRGSEAAGSSGEGAPGAAAAADARAPAAGGEGRPAPPGRTAALDDWLAALAACARTEAAGVRHAGGRRAKATAPPHEAARAERTRDEAGKSLPSAEEKRAEDTTEPYAAEQAAGREETDAAMETWWSAAGGLVLVYPWLSDLLAEEVEPGRELAYRSWALAAVLSPGAEEPLLADPLVRVLAGDDPASPYRPLVRPPEPDDLADRAEGVLRSFAAALPGFERSSPPYLRQFLLVRGALVARLPRDEGYGVRLEPAPLDPVLALLPYPLTGFRFAWSEPIRVELKDARG